MAAPSLLLYIDRYVFWAECQFVSWLVFLGQYSLICILYIFVPLSKQFIFYESKKQRFG